MIPIIPAPVLHSALSGSRDAQVQSPEAASDAAAGDSARPHAGGRRPDRARHLGPAGTRRASRGGRRRVLPRHPPGRPGLVSRVPLLADVRSHPGWSPPAASSSAASAPFSAAAIRSGRAASGVAAGVQARLAPPGSHLAPLLRQQPAADGQEEAEEDVGGGRRAVEER